MCALVCPGLFVSCFSYSLTVEVAMIRLSLVGFAFALVLVASMGVAVARVPVHGRWCGPGNSKNPGAPIDAIDRQCQKHDVCVWRTLKRKRIKKYVHGLQYCKCDAAILRGMSGAIRSTRSKKAKRKGRLIQGYFRRTRCFCDKRKCMWVPNCRKVRRCKILRKRVCVKVPKCTKVRKCKTLRKRVCAKVPKCRKVRKCTTIQVLGRGGRCPSGSR